MRPACHKMGKKVATSCAEEGSLQAGIGFSISPGQALFSGDFIGETALELVQGDLLSPRCMLHMSKLALQLLYLSFCCTGLVFPLRNRAGGCRSGHIKWETCVWLLCIGTSREAPALCSTDNVQTLTGKHVLWHEMWPVTLSRFSDRAAGYIKALVSIQRDIE